MNDKDKTKEQLINELTELRKRDEGLEKAEFERKWSEAASRQLADIFQYTHIGVAVGTARGLFETMNPAYAEMHGYTIGELIGRPVADVYAPETYPKFPEIFRHVNEKGYLSYETLHIRKDGIIFPVQVEAYGVRDEKGNFLYQIATVQDITERKQKAEELGKLTRILRARNKSSHAMIEAVDESWYLNEVCRIIVEDCGHTMVWIGFADDDKDKTIRPVAHAGFEEGYLESLKVTWADTDRGRGPVGTAIRIGKPVIIQDTATDDRFAPWRADALGRGYASVIGVPLLSEGKAFGSLNIYSGHPNSFTKEEAELLNDLAADLSYGITAIRTRSAQAEAEEALRASEEKLRGVLDATPFPVALVDVQDNRIHYWSRSALALFGHTAPTASEWYEIAYPDPDYRREVIDQWKPFLEIARGSGQPVNAGEYRITCSDGSVRMCELYATFLSDILIVTFNDITERKQVEKEMRQKTALLEAQLNSTLDGVLVVDTKGKKILQNRRVAELWKIPQHITDNADDATQVQHVMHMTKNPEQFVEKVMYLYNHPNDTTRDEVELKDGTVLDRYSAPVLGKDGQNYGRIWTFHDITERKQADDKVRASLKEKEILLKEIHHRVKNNLQIISSMLNLQSAYVKDKQALDLFTESRNRVKSMALIHEKLYQSKDLARIDFTDYVRTLTGDLVRSYRGSAAEIVLKIDIEDVFLDIDKAVSCGLIINELITNSLKHAFPSGREGEIKIGLHPDINGMLALTVSDNGTGLPENVDSRNVESLGLQLVALLVEQLDGTIELDRSGGTSFKISFRGIINTVES